MLVQLHPDVARLVWKFGRWHHEVDYLPFRNNKFIPKGEKPEGIDNYGMEIVDTGKDRLKPR
jgi:hypothetical protein